LTLSGNEPRLRRVQDQRISVAFPTAAWYPACQSSDLGNKPLAISLMERPVVVYRDASGTARALEDRCPHRNLALSLGRVHGDGTLECGYHGWRFAGDGRCTAVPGLCDGAGADVAPRTVPSHATHEQDGFVWVWATADSQPDGAPLVLPPMHGMGAGEVVFPIDLECTLHAALENSLDVPHTAFLHHGIFRNGDQAQNEITAVRRDIPGGVEVQFLGEPVGFSGIRLGRARDLTFDHWDRFLLPSTAQIEYRVGSWLRIVNTILHLPMAPTLTRAWFVVRWSTPVPAPALRPIFSVRGRKILAQDARVLAEQAATIRRFGGERYTSTELDLLGPAIWRLLRQAEKGETPRGGDDPDVRERTVTLRA
jgi:phenylpropionate dioxygenase-like ring-hydroxylating dioxygenase large terminal subunit